MLFSKNVFTSVDIIYKWKMPWIDISQDFMLDLLVKARNGRKFIGEKKEFDWKGERSYKEGWRFRKIGGGVGKKARGDGKTGKSSQATQWPQRKGGVVCQ